MCATVSWHSTVGRITSINISYLGKVPSSWHEIRLSPLGRTARGWYGDPSWGSDAGLTAWPWCSQAHQCWCEGDLHSIPCFTSWCLQSSACCVKQQKTRLLKTLLLYLHPELFVYHERCCEVILCQNKVFTHVFLSWHPHWEQKQLYTSYSQTQGIQWQSEFLLWPKSGAVDSCAGQVWTHQTHQR